MRIVVKDLRKTLGERRVLDGLSLAIEPGQTVAILGPSGGGKSTLLRCLNGLLPFEEGTIDVGGIILKPGTSGNGNSAVAARIRRLLGMVFQDFQLFPHLSALGNVVEAPMRVLGQSRAEAHERGLALLDRVGLRDRADAWPRQLSGGQKQRVAIARALAMSPQALLCDEITSALDPELKGEVLEVLVGLKAEGITLVCVTHEIGFARRASDRVVVLDGGRMIEDGPPAQVLDAPKTARTRQFLSRILV